LVPPAPAEAPGRVDRPAHEAVRFKFTHVLYYLGGMIAIGAMTLFMATAMGIPVSTTHTITGAIVGVGSSHKMSAVRWGVAGNIVWAWVFTIPASAFVAAIAWWVGRQIL
jgi:phosphate/sulfate permease